VFKAVLQIFPNEFELFEVLFAVFPGFQLPHGNPDGFDVSLLLQIIKFVPGDV
jgi:hypothetical protein